jgi:DNA-binding response OmpR family regulator
VQHRDDGRFSGPSVLVIEDEPLIALMIEDMLRDHGLAVSVAMQLEPASEMARTVAFDCAILDIFLHGMRSFAVADILAGRGIPFMFTTGGSKGAIDARFKDRAVLTKPFAEDELLAETMLLLGSDGLQR